MPMAMNEPFNIASPCAMDARLSCYRQNLAPIGSDANHFPFNSIPRGAIFPRHLMTFTPGFEQTCCACDCPDGMKD
jgi:hypothetical protein